jgi:hypothetical protein
MFGGCSDRYCGYEPAGQTVAQNGCRGLALAVHVVAKSLSLLMQDAKRKSDGPTLSEQSFISLSFQIIY